MNLVSIFIILLFAFVSSTQDDTPIFGSRITLGEIANDDIDEASGLVASINNKGVLWTHNDSGGENRIFALDTNGNNLGVFYLEGAENRDWEDIAIGPGPDDNFTYLYIGDIGDNNKEYTQKYVYRIKEPKVLVGQNFVDTTLSDVSTITLKYPDSERDAETLMIDPLTKDIFILSKRNTKVRLYKAVYPQSTTSIVNMSLEIKLTFPKDPEKNKPFNYITAGEISLDGKEIIVKTYEDIYYWGRNENESIKQAMNKDPISLPYTKEPQGEALCWKPYDEKGYYTLSEERKVFGIYIQTVLYYYPRTSPVSIKSKLNNPKDFILEQNYPNPFNPSTIINYTIPITTNVKIEIFNSLGQLIQTLLSEVKIKGEYKIVWNGKDSNGKVVNSGVYFYKIETSEFTTVKKMSLVR